MKTVSCVLLLILGIIIPVSAGSISGNITYSGTATDPIVVGIFPQWPPDGAPDKDVVLNSPGSYTITDIPDGTYYVLSIMAASLEDIKITDPWGSYGAINNLTPVVISGSNTVSNIDINLIDGTNDQPNPFASDLPVTVLQLPETTASGVTPALASDGTWLYLYKHDFEGAGTGKIYKINPETGEIVSTHNLTLQYTANGISWIQDMTFFQGDLWAAGGYGDPSGSGIVEGVFMVDITNSTSSNQIPDVNNLMRDGLTNDDTHLFASVYTNNTFGIIKFNPYEVSEVPESPDFTLGNEVYDLCFGNGYLWVDMDRVSKIELPGGNNMGDLNISGAEAYLDHKLWDYEEYSNTLLSYSLETVGVEKDIVPLSTFNLSQNYPNPFNPVTMINYQMPVEGHVTLKVFDALGNEVATLVDETKSSGQYSVPFNAVSLSSGVYFYRISINDFTSTKKLILMK